MYCKVYVSFYKKYQKSRNNTVHGYQIEQINYTQYSGDRGGNITLRNFQIALV